MRKAAGMGLSVAKPWNADERYDFIVRVETVCWRVQVKSVKAKSPGRHHYRVQTATRTKNAPHNTYSAAEIDFLVAYIFPEDLWYVFPAARIAGKKSICVWPGSKRSTSEQYCEAWKLMKPRPANVEFPLLPKPGRSAAPDPDSQVLEPAPRVLKTMTDP